MTGSGKAWHPTATRVAWIPVSELRVDRYERKLNPRKLSQIVRDFDPDAIGTIYVSERDGYVIMDGQHRVEAVRRMWGPKEKVPCQIYAGLSLEDEARLFGLFNEKRTKPRPFDLFQARLIAGEEVALAIREIVEAHGLFLGAGQSDGVIQAVQTLEDIYVHGSGEVSGAVLSRTLDVLLSAWGKDSHAFQTVPLKAVGILISRYRSTINQQRLVHVLRETVPGQIVARARYAREAGVTHGGTVILTTVAAQIILGLYNRRLHNGQLTWVDKPSVKYWEEDDPKA